MYPFQLKVTDLANLCIKIDDCSSDNIWTIIHQPGTVTFNLSKLIRNIYGIFINIYWSAPHLNVNYKRMSTANISNIHM